MGARTKTFAEAMEQCARNQELLARNQAKLDATFESIRRSEAGSPLEAHEHEAVWRYARDHGIADADEAVRRYKADRSARIMANPALAPRDSTTLRAEDHEEIVRYARQNRITDGDTAVRLFKAARARGEV